MFIYAVTLNKNISKNIDVELSTVTFFFLSSHGHAVYLCLVDMLIVICSRPDILFKTAQTFFVANF